METRSGLRILVQKGIYGGLAFLACMVSVMGYYPLVPSYYAMYSLRKKGNWLIYLGLFAGIAYFMPFQSAVKYIFILTILHLAIHFYIWANCKCSGWVAGSMGAVVTIVMNCSGNSFAGMGRGELLLGISEGIMVFGFTILFHFVEEMLLQAKKQLPQMARVEQWNQTKGGEIPLADTKVTAFVSAVNGLSEAFQGMGQVREKSMLDYAAGLERELAGQLCMNCEGCAICWDQNYMPLSNGIRRMLYDVVAHRPKQEILESEFIEGCPHYAGLVDAAIDAFGKMELNEAWYRRLIENRQVIAQQLDAMADLLLEWTHGSKNIDKAHWILISKIAYEAKERGIIAQGIHLYEDENGRLSVQATVEGKWGGGIPMSQFVQAVEKAVKCSMRVERDAKSILTKEPVDVILYEDTGFYTLPGIASRKKDGSVINGDNFVMFDQDQGTYHVCLSDGMGSGNAANRESELVVDLLQKFIEAGFPKETAIKMMNSAMVLQGEEESFSTLDYASIDMYTGKLELIKIGAAATFIKSKEGVECLDAGSLPAGVDLEQELFVQKRQLESGDFLVMVTDGVLEYLHAENQEEFFGQLLKEIRSEHAGTMAKEIMSQVLKHTGGFALDDMTVLVIGLWEK